jgi:hypothetical protein
MSASAEAWTRADWMQTYTGKAFTPLDPQAVDVDMLDIAHALSMLCRYGGHTSRFYSVAEHCVLVSEALERDGYPPDVALWGLLHDAAEAYLGDVIRPVKRSMPGYRDAEACVLAAIASRLGLLMLDYPTVVTEYDNRILQDERVALLSAPPLQWDSVEQLAPLGVSITGRAPDLAEAQYLERLHQLLPEGRS